MPRKPSQHRRRIVVTAISMWYQLLLQLVVMLSDLTTNNRTSNASDDPIPRSLPYGREMYRGGFLLNCTTTTEVTCISMLRMKRRIFWKFCDLLKEAGGLKPTKNMEVSEMVAIFLLTIGHNAKNRTCQVLFHRSGETVFRSIRCVLLAVLKLHHILLAQPVEVPENCNDPRWKYFKGCVGALDGTMVNVRTTIASRSRYRNRKGSTSINILAVCNQDLQFIYCLAGWEGSAHDSRVLRDALSREGGLRVPEGKYYLCDAGYTNANGFLAPYRGQRYHLQEWGANRPTSAEEYFNMKHSSARNVIERAFGVLKMRWALLRDTSWFSPKMVGLLFTSCCLIHNFIMQEAGGDVFTQAYIPSMVDHQNVIESIDDAPSYVEPSEEWSQFRHSLAHHMWATRGR